MGAPYGLTHAKQLRVAVVQLNWVPAYAGTTVFFVYSAL
jgi:hypothetical protein